MGDLILVYKRVTALAGHTSRVAELLEQVHDSDLTKDTALHHAGVGNRQLGPLGHELSASYAI